MMKNEINKLNSFAFHHLYSQSLTSNLKRVKKRNARSAACEHSLFVVVVRVYVICFFFCRETAKTRWRRSVDLSPCKYTTSSSGWVICFRIKSNKQKKILLLFCYSQALFLTFQTIYLCFKIKLGTCSYFVTYFAFIMNKFLFDCLISQKLFS